MASAVIDIHPQLSLEFQKRPVPGQDGEEPEGDGTADQGAGDEARHVEHPGQPGAAHQDFHHRIGHQGPDDPGPDHFTQAGGDDLSPAGPV